MSHDQKALATSTSRCIATRGVEAGHFFIAPEKHIDVLVDEMDQILSLGRLQAFAEEDGLRMLFGLKINVEEFIVRGRFTLLEAGVPQGVMMFDPWVIFRLKYLIVFIGFEMAD